MLREHDGDKYLSDASGCSGALSAAEAVKPHRSCVAYSKTIEAQPDSVFITCVPAKLSIKCSKGVLTW
jgi:hypothetical protein